jgi:iron complex transport system substrate-binding protein
LTGRFRATPLVLGCLALLNGCEPVRGAPNARVVITDDAGDSVHLAAPPVRIVSLNPTTTELLFAIGAGARVVGRTKWCDFPAAARPVPSVGDGFPPNVEAVLRRRPDLVVIYRGALNDGAVRRLRELGVPVLALRTDRLEDLARAARMLGAVTGARRAGDSLAAALDSTLASARAAASGAATIPVVILASSDPAIAIGAGSYLHEVVELAGGRNLFADLPAASGPVSLEAVTVRDPDLIVAVGSAARPGLGRPEWQAVRAVREGRVLLLSEPALARPTPRAPAAIAALRDRLTLALPRRSTR